MSIVRRSVVTGVALVAMVSLAVAHGPTRKKHTGAVFYSAAGDLQMVG